jgi:hypothetical protein
MPVTRRNTVVKWLGVRNPTVRAIRATERSEAASSVMADAIRLRTTKRWGGMPVLRLNSRAKWYGLMPATAPSCARVGA